MQYQNKILLYENVIVSPIYLSFSKDYVRTTFFTMHALLGDVCSHDVLKSCNVSTVPMLSNKHGDKVQLQNDHH